MRRCLKCGKPLTKGRLCGGIYCLRTWTGWKP
jgi:hypothetical protein